MLCLQKVFWGTVSPKPLPVQNALLFIPVFKNELQPRRLVRSLTGMFNNEHIDTEYEV